MEALTETSVAAFAERHEDADSPDDRGAEEPSLASVSRRRPGHGRALPQPRHRHGDGPGEDHAHPPPEGRRHQQVHQVRKLWPCRKLLLKDFTLSVKFDNALFSDLI